MLSKPATMLLGLIYEKPLNAYEIIKLLNYMNVKWWFNIADSTVYSKSTLSKALDYIENPDKTDGKMLISSFGCSYETADIEFGYTLSQALDKGNNLAFHLIQSFAPGEVDYEKAHEIGKQLADAVTKGQHALSSGVQLPQKRC